MSEQSASRSSLQEKRRILWGGAVRTLLEGLWGRSRVRQPRLSNNNYIQYKSKQDKRLLRFRHSDWYTPAFPPNRD